MPNGWDRTMSYTAWLSSPSTSACMMPASDGNRGNTHASPVGLYVGAHDPIGRLKMLPVSCNRSSGRAVLRALHVPPTFTDRSTANWTLPYPVVVAAFQGDWWDASQLFRRWAVGTTPASPAAPPLPHPPPVWTTKGNLSARTDIPRWVLHAPLWVRLSGVDPLANSTHAMVHDFRMHEGV